MHRGALKGLKNKADHQKRRGVATQEHHSLEGSRRNLGTVRSTRSRNRSLKFISVNQGSAWREERVLDPGSLTNSAAYRLGQGRRQDGDSSRLMEGTVEKRNRAPPQRPSVSWVCVKKGNVMACLHGPILGEPEGVDPQTSYLRKTQL